MIAILILLIVIGIVDIFLYFRGKPTISQRIHKLPLWTTLSIMIAILVASWWVGGIILFVPVLVGTVNGHVFGRF